MAETGDMNMMGTFQNAIEHAIEARSQWLTPINIWMRHGADSVQFEARANTVPPGRPTDEVLLHLSDDTLEILAQSQELPAEFEYEITRILQNAQDG